MTNRFVATLSAVSLIAVLSPLAASIDAAEVTSQIPFSFAVNGTTLPAGHYRVTTQDGTLSIRGLTRSVIVLGQPAKSLTRTTPKMVFDKTGDSYTLREVWTGGYSGQTFPGSRTREDRKSTANTVAVEQVVIAAR